MRVAVVGAGGVGGLVAGLLARAGHDVVLVARGAALEAVRARGLHVESPLGIFDVKVEVSDSPRDLAPAPAVLLAVKTWQVPETAASIAPLVAPGGFVVPLQNGVDAPEQCASALGEERVVGGLCHVLSWIAEPGSVKHVGDAPRVTLGALRSPLDGRADALATALEGAGIRAVVTDDYARALWEKLLLIASFGGVGAITRAALGVIRTIPETRALLVAAFEEVRAVASAKGVATAPDIVAKTLALVDRLPEAATASLQRDVVAGRPSEIDALCGAVARIGAEVSVPVPVHTTMYAALLPQERAARSSRRA